jgi:hypothetical protein
MEENAKGKTAYSSVRERSTCHPEGPDKDLKRKTPYSFKRERAAYHPGGMDENAKRKTSCSFDREHAAFHAEGMDENSPTFQGWVSALNDARVPKGRLNRSLSPGNASFQPSLAGLGHSPRLIPKLKHWAILKSPFGRKTRTRRFEQHALKHWAIVTNPSGIIIKNLCRIAFAALNLQVCPRPLVVYCKTFFKTFRPIPVAKALAVGQAMFRQESH